MIAFLDVWYIDDIKNPHSIGEMSMNRRLHTMLIMMVRVELYPAKLSLEIHTNYILAADGHCFLCSELAACETQACQSAWKWCIPLNEMQNKTIAAYIVCLLLQ